MSTPTRLRLAAGCAGLLVALLVAGPSRAQTDDTILFTSTAVIPNVMFVIDSSETMNHIIWHPDFDPNATYTCNPANFADAWDPDTIYFFNSNQTTTRCGITRTIRRDPNATGGTRYDGRYLNWLFSPEANAAYAEYSQTNNGLPSSCVGGSSFPRYQRTRMNTAKQVLQDVICQVNLIGAVRFGIATFRTPGSGTNDPNGGYVIAEINMPTSKQQSDLFSAIQSLRANTWSPLGEALFQIYTYFMNRDPAKTALGQDGSTLFPIYPYRTSSAGVGGTPAGSPGQYLADPVLFTCQKHFVVIITDGQPTMDTFEAQSPTDTALGFGNFHALIGDYHDDGEVEEPHDLFCAGCKTALYLDDIAHFMQQNDFRPDMDGFQNIDVYTVGFASGALSDELLLKAAQVGNGLFLKSNNEDELAARIIEALTHILEKAQSFTAATVPASRTAAGNQLYVSLFTPDSATQYWAGSLRSYHIDAAGRILDKFGQCAVEDPSNLCLSGPIKPVEEAPPFWDAANEIPAPNARNLLVSLQSQSTNVGTFRHTSFTPAGPVTAADLGVTFPPPTPYPASAATDAEELAAEIVANVRGCMFGTGANGVPCLNRPFLLTDIFHSNPVVVGSPSLFFNELSYKSFASAFATRERVIYAGSNGGFLHGFHAGTWRTSPPAAQPGHDVGTGAELFGFMPWEPRTRIRHLPIDTGMRDYYFVDGSPTVTDAWLWTNPLVDAKQPNGSEWRTVLVGGLRQGGGSYYALDVTDPGATSCVAPARGAGYPCYLWEFPEEDDTRSYRGVPYADMMGESWGEPILVKIRLKGNANPAKGWHERWVAVVTGGYHSSGDPNHPGLAYDPDATEGRAIWVLDLKTGDPIAVKAFDTSGDCTPYPPTSAPAYPDDRYNPANPEANMCYAIASTPAVYDLSFDGFADTIVVGDLGGNVWKWTLSVPGDDPAADPLAQLSQPDWKFRKLFQAPVYYRQQGGVVEWQYKSFFFPPAATLVSGTMWLAIGSGERADLLREGNPNRTGDNNRLYSFRDLDPLERQDPPRPVILETDLLNVSNNHGCSNVSAYQGWYIIGREGEKWVTNADIFGGYLFVNSYRPKPAEDPCEIGGESFLYGVRVQCGEGFFQDAGGNPLRDLALGVGLPTDPRITIGQGGASTNRLIVNKQGGELINVQAPPGFGAGIGIHYWRELRQ